jgi:sugar/nucleoside kinase (ribokinase family)
MIARLVSLGSVIVDLILDVPRLPERGGDVLASQRGTAVGGAFNVLSAASRLGLPAVYAGPHGTGPFGDQVRAELAREGIAVAREPNPRLDTGWTIALIEPDAERTFVTVTGADALVEPGDLDRMEYREGDAVYVSGYDLAYPAAGAAVAAHVTRLPRHAFVVFDPGPLVAEIDRDLLHAVVGRADMVSLNARECRALGDVSVETVVIRHGAGGATIHRRGEPTGRVDAVHLEQVADTSGAGDVHVGANLAGLARGLSWPDAVLLANRAAAYAVSRPGPASGPTVAQLEDFGRDRW